MLEKLQLLYPAVDVVILSVLIDTAEDFVKAYCNLDEIPPALNSTLMAMVREDINKLGGEGFNSETAGGANVSYETDYTDRIYKQLVKFKRIKTVCSTAE